MCEKETVSMYKISKELAFEKNHDFVVMGEDGEIKIIGEKKNAFDNFNKEQVKRLKELLEVKGIEKDAVKEGKGFAIPADSKNYIKFLLLNYTSSPIREIRKKGLENLEYSKWKELVKGLVDYSTEGITNSIEKEEIKNNIYAQHQYFSSERQNRLIDNISEMLKEAELRYGSFENIGQNSDSNKEELTEGKKPVNQNGFSARLLNENDAIELYNYLEKKIYQCFIETFEVANIFSEIRHGEIEDKISQALHENKDPENITYDDSKVVLEEALRDFKCNY